MLHPLKIYILAQIVPRLIGGKIVLCPKSFTDSAARSARLVAYRLVGLQAVVVVIIALCWWIKEVTETLSALLGGAVSVLPSFYFAWRLFAITSSLAAKRIVVSFFLGELVKLALSTVLVILTIVFIPVAIVPFIIGFMGAQFGFLFAPFLWTLGSRLDNVKSTQ